MIITIEYMRKRDGELMALYIKPNGDTLVSAVGRKRVLSGEPVDPEDMGNNAGYFGFLLSATGSGAEVIGLGLLQCTMIRQISGSLDPQERRDMHDFEFACAGLCHDRNAAVKVHRELTATIERVAAGDYVRNEQLFAATDDFPDLPDDRPRIDWQFVMDPEVRDGGEYVPGMSREPEYTPMPKRMLN